MGEHHGHGGHGGHHGNQHTPYHRRQSPLVSGSGGKSNETVLTLRQACVVEDEDSEKEAMDLRFAGECTDYKYVCVLKMVIVGTGHILNG
jgi:hypothetical protein